MLPFQCGMNVLMGAHPVLGARGRCGCRLVAVVTVSGARDVEHDSLPVRLTKDHQNPSRTLYRSTATFECFGVAFSILGSRYFLMGGAAPESFGVADLSIHYTVSACQDEASQVSIIGNLT